MTHPRHPLFAALLLAALAFPAAAGAAPGCPAGQRVHLALGPWRQELRAAATPDRISRLLARLKLAPPPEWPDCAAARVLGVDRFTANLSRPDSADQVVQVRMRFCISDRMISGLRVQVLRRLGGDDYCLLGDGLSIDQPDAERFCDPDTATAPESCGNGSCACAPRVDPEQIPPRVLSFVHLTDAARQTIQVQEAKGNGSSCCLETEGTASVSFWDVRDGRLVRMLSLVYRRLGADGEFTRTVEIADKDPFPKKLYSCEAREGPRRCEEVFAFENGSYRRVAVPPEGLPSERRSIVPQSSQR